MLDMHPLNIWYYMHDMADQSAAGGMLLSMQAAAKLECCGTVRASYHFD